MKKKIKLIALDLDDTFLDDDKGIPKENELAVQEAIAKGVYVVVSTGRSLTAIPMEENGVIKTASQEFSLNA